VLAVLAAASATGCEACLYPPTASTDLVAELAEAFGHEGAVFSRRDELGLPSVDELLAGHSSDDWSGDVSAERPHLVLTTGTTGRPKAVRHDWSRLVASALESTLVDDERWLLAYGMNQFGGLQVLIHVMCAGATLVATDAFSPVLGLKALREHAVTHASATPTYWRFLLNELADDGGMVPPLRQITLGGEAPDQLVLDRLAATFTDARLTHIYAANELGAVRSVHDARVGLPLSALDDAGDVELKVVDGELWARAPRAMLGYHDAPSVDGAEWRATGDLVEIVGDRLLFRGRTSDVINVGGVKVHPLPIEERLSGIDGVAAARVFGRSNALTGAVVAVEIVAAPGSDPDDIDTAVRDACANLPPASRPRSIRFVDAIRVEGNKIIRR